MTFSIEEVEGRQQWQPDAQDCGTFFRTWEWVSFIEKAFSGRRRLLLIRKDGMSLHWPFVEVRKGGLKVWGSPLPGWMTPYMSPSLEGLDAQGVLKSLNEYLRSRRVDHVELSFPAQVDAQLLERTGYNATTCQTLLLDLAGSAEDVWKNKITSKCRNQIRKAQKLNVEIRRVGLSEILDQYVKMDSEVFSKYGRSSPVGRDFYADMADIPGKADMIWTLAAVHENEIVAAGIFPVIGARVHYLSGVSTARGNEVCANNLMQWELIQLACQAGKSTYDMVGANMPSIARFKASFGSEPFQYTSAHASFSARARIGRWLYKNVRPVFRRIKYLVRKDDAASS